MKNSIKVLDVTLRDGGCVNNFDFGQHYMEEILKAQELSGVEYIELGYLDHVNGTANGRTQFSSEEVIENSFLSNKKEGTVYLAMMDYGKYDPSFLPPRSEKTIDGIRLAFHKEDREKIKQLGKIIIDKGYLLFVQPMLTLRYSDRELLDLVEMVNTDLSDATALYIVDSFGEMRSNDVERLVNLIHHNLSPKIALGFHSHNNLQLSYSNAMTFLQFHINRDIIVDASIMGMGKGAGNLNTELLLEHINLFYDGKYNIVPLLEVIDSCIGVLHEEYLWGYSPEYYLSSINHCSPTYAGYLYSKHRLRIDQIGEVLSSFDEKKKISFDKAYAEEKYREYNTRKEVDDSEFVKAFYETVNEKDVLIIAPGGSIKEYFEDLKEIALRNNVITIALNADFKIRTDYYLITRNESKNTSADVGVKRILLSNIVENDECLSEQDAVIDYKRWITVDNETRDSSSVICLNLLKQSGTKKIMLAGFDGFSADINENYYEKSMRRTLTESKAKEQNEFFSCYIREYKKFKNVEFVTPTKYVVL